MKKTKRESTLESALDVLQTVFQKRKGAFADEYKRLRLEQSWEQIVGKDLAKETFPRKLYKSTLYVSAKSSEARYHCRFSQDIILMRINKHLGDSGRIDNLNFSEKPKKSAYDKKGKDFIDKIK